MHVQYFGLFLFQINVADTDSVTICWGDGTPVETRIVNPAGNKEWEYFRHNYSDLSEYTIRVTGKNITELSVTGGLPSEEAISVFNGHLTSLDVSKNKKLTTLFLWKNNILSLDVSKNHQLTYLSCRNNLMTNLKVGGVLTELFCHQNRISNLDLSMAVNLETVFAEYNQLANLDVRKSTKLRGLAVDNNYFSAQALNDLFETLPHAHEDDRAGIRVFSNPGALDCDRSIAIKKGWNVN